MKVRLFKSLSKSGKAYWSVVGKNYKDSNDKVTYFFSFGKKEVEPNTEVGTTKDGRTYEYADIDILEAKFSSFKNTPSITIFSYAYANEGAKSVQRRDNEINFDDLPF